MSLKGIYGKYAKYYDKIYDYKEYDQEVLFVKNIVQKHNIKQKDLLDVACGTATHAKLLVDDGFNITGVDLSKEMLKIAKKKVKKAKFIEGDMKLFKSKNKYNILTCFFTAINYNYNLEELQKTLTNFYNLLKKDGIVIFDIGLTEKNIKTDIFITTASNKTENLARIGQWEHTENKNIKILKNILIIKEKGKLDFVIDNQKLGVFSVKNVKKIMT